MTRNRAVRAGLLTMATAALSATAFAGMAGSATADPGTQGENHFGCPYGAVCLYEGHSWNNNTPEHVYWTYGVHQLENEFGPHRIYNNQSGGATAAHCDGADGTDCGKPFDRFTYVDLGDITPVNSIRLMP